MNSSDWVVFVALADLTADSASLSAFYAAFFAQTPTVHVPQVYTEFRLPGLRLGIFQPSADHQTEFIGRAGSMSLCIEVKQLEAAIERLTALGCAPPGTVIQAAHGREIYAYDPAGNRLILHESHLFSDKTSDTTIT